MKAILVEQRGGVEALIAREVPDAAAPTGRDVLVEIKATSVNPVDVKVRGGVYDDYPDYYDHVPSPYQILGYDGAGVVRAMGGDCTSGLQPGDTVFFSGSPFRHGTNAEMQLVDEASLARTPESLDFVEAAAMPLTWLTAYEALVERLEIQRAEPAAILVINGAGGVGAVASQIARVVLDLPAVITTASRSETVEFSKSMGATHVINHHEDLERQIAELKLEVPLKYIFITRNTDEYLPVVSRIAAPFGKVCSIVQGQASMYGTEFMAKSLTYSWELLSTKARYPDALHQPGSRVRPHGEMLTELARLIDDGKIKCHLTKRLRLTLAGLKEAHELVESGKSIGKVGLGVEEAGEGEAFA